MADSASTPTSSKKVRGVDGRVKEMVSKFGSGQKAATPMEAERRRIEAQNAKAMAARYNMVLRGHQIMAQRKKYAAENHVDFLPHEFSEEWEEYPWHLAAAFTDEDDAFWMPELALALEENDEREINRAILRFFLEENDPDRIAEVDTLLNQFAGNEETLFISLNKEYNNPPPTSNDESDQKPNAVDEIRSVGTSTVFSQGEEEKSPDPATIQRRRPSYVVSGLRRESGWTLNAVDDEMKQKMEESGEPQNVVSTVVSVATANAEPFAPGGSD